MAFLVRWTDAEGDKAALALYAEAIEKEYTGVAAHDGFSRTVTPEELARLAATELGAG
jgi:hypothetical protein